MITLHVEDSFDLHNVAKVAWEIHKIVADDISSRGLSYMTDRTTVTYSGKGCTEEGDPLYLFPATCFSDKQGVIKSLEAFTSTFIYIATQFAQKRQQILKDVQKETFFNEKTVIEDVRELNTNQIANFFAQESQKILKEAFERRKNNHLDSDDSSDEEIGLLGESFLRFQVQDRMEQKRRMQFFRNFNSSNESSDSEDFFSHGIGNNSFNQEVDLDSRRELNILEMRGIMDIYDEINDIDDFNAILALQENSFEEDDIILKKMHDYFFPKKEK
ncbi:MAG: hypothetical protein BGO10_02690 [Chlamydia sp. 32-24]|nr:MAG: hypothetical protein BGO10_02690 [Chlamydia sp. 32-24]